MSTRLSTLGNGLRVATDQIDTVDTVSLGIWVDVGTRHEPAAINGAAHFLEHMAFKGTERRSARAIAEEIEAVGGQKLDDVERAHIERILRETGHNISKTARILDIDRTTLYNKLRRYGQM